MRNIPVILCGAVAWAAEPNTAIKLNQAGYLPDVPKLAMVVAATPAQSFTVRPESGGDAVYSGSLSAPTDDANSGDRVQVADFSGFRTSGRYYIEVPEVGRSYSFEIGPNVYRRAYYLAMRSYYGQRCGIAVNMGPEFPLYSHAECHRTGAWHDSSGKQGTRVSEFGWHDAGDFGRYIVNSGITTGTLLWAWELYGARVAGISLDIPESGRRTPDVLSEIRWNLEWMLSMQDEDGGVWQKQASVNFPGFIMPERDTLTSFAIGTGAAPFKSSCATADFAAVMAIAQRVYQKHDAVFATRAGDAAARAWTWVSAHPNVVFRNPAGVVTGEYGDNDCSDERLWAAAELWRTTGGADYHAYFLSNFRRFVNSVRKPGWPTVGPLALWTYVLARRPDADADGMESIRAATAQAADVIADRTASNPYRIALTSADYVWGSNGEAANYAMLLTVAHAITQEQRYFEAALENLHYLLGRNTFSVSWVTWVGTNWFKHPHHRPSGADGVAEPWPGLVSGGPNKNREDAVLAAMPAGLPPMKVWADDQNSYASNENCINWNAPVVFVLAAMLPEPQPRPQPARPHPSTGVRK